MSSIIFEFIVNIFDGFYERYLIFVVGFFAPEMIITGRYSGDKVRLCGVLCCVVFVLLCV